PALTLLPVAAGSVARATSPVSTPVAPGKFTRSFPAEVEPINLGPLLFILIIGPVESSPPLPKVDLAQKDTERTLVAPASRFIALAAVMILASLVLPVGIEPMPVGLGVIEPSSVTLVPVPS